MLDEHREPRRWTVSANKSVFQVRKAVSLLPVLTARERVTFERHQTILCIAAHGTLR